MAAWTMNRPTMKDSTPSAFRFRWKLSVRRSRLFSSPLFLITSRSFRAAGSAGFCRAKSLASSIPDNCPGWPNNGCAKPMSVSKTPGAISSLACKGGSGTPVSVNGCWPSSSPSACRVCGAIHVMPGGVRKSTTCAAFSVCPASAEPVGKVTGSIPISCRRRSSRP